MQKSIFENAAVILLLIDSKKKVKDINRVGLKMIGKEKIDVLNKAGGEVFNCVSAWKDGNVVCGQEKNCSDCMVRKSVERTLLTDQGIYKQEGYLDIFHDDRKIRLDLLISTAKVLIDGEECVLLTIDEITDIKKKGKATFRS